MASPAEQTTGNRIVVEDTIQIPAPTYDVYRRWADFQRYPDFIHRIEKVQPLGGNRYHWIGKVFGSRQEWDSEIAEEQPNQRLSWRSVSGPHMAETITLYSPSTNTTEVRVRFEYDAPSGRGNAHLRQLESTLRKDLRSDLTALRSLFTNEPIPGGAEGQSLQGVIASMAAPLAAGALGGAAGWWLEKNNTSRRVLRKMPTPLTRVETPAVVTSWIFTGASAASVLVSAGLRLRRDSTNALFVGQWAPTLLEAGLLARVVGHRGVRTPENTAGVSWGFAGASLGSVIASATLHGIGQRQDGLFVGQWAPSLLSASLFARLFDR